MQVGVHGKISFGDWERSPKRVRSSRTVRFLTRRAHIIAPSLNGVRVGGVRMVEVENLMLKVRNSVAAIVPASEAAEAWLKRSDPSPEAEFFLLLAIEELVTNCIKYGYDDSSEHTIVVELSVADHVLTVTVTDDGHPFDPLSVPPPNLSLDIQDRPIGGLGIFLLRELADQIAYERRDNKNRLTLTKQIA